MTTKAATDALLAALNIAPEIPEGTGLTTFDFMRNHNLGYGTARNTIAKLVEAKLLREIGTRRNGRGVMKVYEMVGKRKK